VAWSRVNPSTIIFLEENPEDGKKESTLFGGGFLERLADENTLVKVTENRTETRPQQRCQKDPNDSTVFFERAPCSRKPQCHQLYPDNNLQLVARHSEVKA